MQRITPVQATCAATQQAVRGAVARLAEQHVRNRVASEFPEASCAPHTASNGAACRYEPDQGMNVGTIEENDLQQVRFAVAYRSRTAEPHSSELEGCNRDIRRAETATASAAASSTREERGRQPPSTEQEARCSPAADAERKLPEHAVQSQTCTTQCNDVRRSAEEQHAGATVGPELPGGNALEPAAPRDAALDRRQCIAAAAQGFMDGAAAAAAGAAAVSAPDLATEFSKAVKRERSVEVSIAAGAKSGVAAVVDLKQPEVVVMVEVLPIGRRSLCGLSIVSADCVSLKPKLVMKLVGPN